MNIEFHVLDLMEMEMISWTFYRIMDYQCGNSYFDLMLVDHHNNEIKHKFTMSYL